MMIINNSLLKLLLLVPLVSMGCESMQKALNLTKPTAKLVGLKFDEVKLDSATLLFDVDVDNPYSVALPLLNLDYDLSSGDVKSFLSGNADLQTTIPAKSTKTVSLPATINYLEMLKALRTIRPGTQLPYQAALGLSVDTPALGRLRIPMGKEGEVYVPKPSDMDINDILRLIKNR